MDDDTRGWLLLMRLPAITRLQLQGLMRVFGSPAGILCAKARALRDAGLNQEMIRTLQVPGSQSMDRDIAWLKQPGHHLIPFTHELYPLRLKEIPEPPPGLFVRGKPETLNTLQLGMVGSRNPSFAGKQNAWKILLSPP